MSEETLTAECTLCATYYKTFRKLRRHFKKRHADLEVLQCYFCDYMTHDKIMFKQHKETSHTDEKFVCENCDFKTRKWTRMERHFDKHKTTKPVTELPSSEDWRSTSRMKEAVQEINQKLIKEQKSDKKLFVCDFCDKHFHSKIRLKEHVQVHSLNHPSKCTLGNDKHKIKSVNEISPHEHFILSCTINETDHSTFRVKETDHSTSRVKETDHSTSRVKETDHSTSRVKETDHSTSRVKETDHSTSRVKETDHSTSSVKETDHSTTIIKEAVQGIIGEIKKPEMEQKCFVCEICKKQFRNKLNLKQHSMVHTQERPYKCTLYDYAGKWKKNLVSHMRIHFDERPFKCTFCEYKSKHTNILKDHIKVHLNKRDFACELCDYKTFTKRYLQLHMRVHSGEKPFKCHICERAFSQRPNFKNHLRRIHLSCQK